MSNDFEEHQSVIARVLGFLLRSRANKAKLQDIYRHVRANRSTIRSALNRLQDAGAVNNVGASTYQASIAKRYQYVVNFKLGYAPYPRNTKQRALFRKKLQYTEFQLKGIMTLAPNKGVKKQKEFLQRKVKRYRAVAIYQHATNHLIDVHNARHIDTDNIHDWITEETEEVVSAPEYQVALWHDADKFMSSQGLVAVFEP